MRPIIMTAFDAPFFGYAKKLIASIRAFHPDVPIIVGDLGLAPEQVVWLEQRGIKVRTSDRVALLRQHGLRLCFGDFLLTSFLRESDEYTDIVWIDADTLLLQPILQALESYRGLVPQIYLDRYVMGHPGRHAGGPIYTMRQRYEIAPGTTHREFIEKELVFGDEEPYVATGLWMTSSRPFLKFLDSLIDKMWHLTDDSPVFSAAMHKMEMRCVRLNEMQWNFSRHMVPQARYESGRIVYGNDRFPFTVGFSLTDNGTRLGSPAIDLFFKEQILPEAKEFA